MSNFCWGRVDPTPTLPTRVAATPTILPSDIALNTVPPRPTSNLLVAVNIPTCR